MNDGGLIGFRLGSPFARDVSGCEVWRIDAKAQESIKVAVKCLYRVIIYWIKWMGAKSAFSVGSIPHTFAAGWNAACDDEPLVPRASADWRAGWRGAMALPPSDRNTYRFNREKIPSAETGPGGVPRPRAV
jgi:hypothetical protein